jgi:AraC-like DNA-binding protein
MDASPLAARGIIARELKAYLRNTPIRAVHFAQSGVAPPPLAYVTSFPRLSIPLAGKHSTEIARHARPVTIALVRGHVLFVGRNCWNRPDWAAPVKVLTFLFGKKQIGISLVRHNGRRGEPTEALKATLGSVDGMTQNILSALVALAEERQTSPLDRLLAEALLQACLQLLDRPAAPHLRKATRTFEAICLYVQENFQRVLTRESVARNFDLAPNHVSRLFRREGCMRFSDYVTLVRIDRAKFMLKEYGSPLKEVAANCGYHHVAYFCRVFRRITKVTPTDYRLKGLRAGISRPPS